MNTKILLLFAMIIGLGACRQDFLDKKPKGQLTFDTFFKTEAHAIEATNAVYQHLRVWDNCSLPWLSITDIISDDADKGSTENDGPNVLEIDNFVFNATNTNIGQSWTGNFQIIFRANVAIANIPNIDMDEDLKNRLIGENKFLRAYAYFRLVQWFGEVPIITTVLNEDEFFTQRRRPINEVYQQIEADLLAAIESLPLKSDYPVKELGRATKGAAQGILAKVYMLQKDYANAEIMCMNVINSNEYDLHTSYSENFLPSGENGKESIFEVTTTATAAPIAGPGASPYNMVQGVRGVPNLGWGFNRPSDDLIAAYEVGDPRRQATIIYTGELLPDGLTIVADNPEILNERYNQKAWVPDHPGLQDNGPGNIRILRYADILLLAAEALNENGKADEALVYVNKIRQRARGSNNFILPDITETNKDLLRDIIRRERRVELAMEQQRWFDLVRWGIAGPVMTTVGKAFVSNKHELFPIPQTEIDLSNGELDQNPGY